MPKYLINKGLESEQTIIAADMRPDGIQYWFYDTKGIQFMSLLKDYAVTVEELPTSSS